MTASNIDSRTLPIGTNDLSFISSYVMDYDRFFASVRLHENKPDKQVKVLGLVRKSAVLIMTLRDWDNERDVSSTNGNALINLCVAKAALVSAY